MCFTHCTHCFKPIDEDENCCIVKKYGINYMFCERCSGFAVNVFMKWHEEIVPIKPQKEYSNTNFFKYPSLLVNGLELI